MRRVRTAVATLCVAVTLSGVGAVSPASATTEPPAGPLHDAFTIQGTGSTPAESAAYAWTPANSTFSFDPHQGYFQAHRKSPWSNWSAHVDPPTGQQFVAGTTYQSLRFPDPTHA